jgi:hypothetical protein
MKEQALTPYFDFSIEKFCRDYIWKTMLLKNYKEQLGDMYGESGLDPTADKVTSSPANDQIEKIVCMRINLEAKIEEIENYFEYFNKALACLTGEERDAIREFFMKDQSPDDAVDVFIERGVDRSTAYRIRRRALEKMRISLFG